jgi:hypothetical protein
MFSFEKLNRSITSVNKVPVIAEVMPTKWAYEALMVRQFKNNRFESNFFDIEQEISYSNFKSAYYIPELEKRLSILDDEFEEKSRIEESIGALEVLKNEILREQDSIGIATYTPSMFVPENFSNEFSAEIKQFFDELNSFYLQKFIRANKIKQGRLNEIMKDRRDIYYQMLNKYQNESVSDQVKKIYEKNKIVESEGRLYQQSDPIFLLPETTRSHFYSPYKIFLNRYFDTFWFNICVIWLLSIIFYLILYADLTRKLIDAPIFKKKISYRLRA